MGTWTRRGLVDRDQVQLSGRTGGRHTDALYPLDASSDLREELERSGSALVQRWTITRRASAATGLPRGIYLRA